MNQAASLQDRWSTTTKTDFEMGVQTYTSTLLKYCRRLTGSQWEAEDLAQDTLLRALPTLTTRYDNPQAYLFRIAKNAWIDKCRKRKVAAKYLKEQQIFDDVVDTLVVQDAIAQLIKHLSPLQRTVVLLRDVFQFTSQESADLLGTTEGAVKAALHRARKTLDTLRSETPPEIGALSKAEAAAEKELLNAYLLAFRNYDMQALVTLAQNDVVHPVQALLTLSTAIQADKRRSISASKQRSNEAAGVVTMLAAA